MNRSFLFYLLISLSGGVFTGYAFSMDLSDIWENQKNNDSEAWATYVNNNKYILNMTDSEKLHLVHYASKAGNESLVKVLVLNHKIDINLQDRQGYTALHYAAQEGHDGIAKFLIENNADKGLVTVEGLTSSDIRRKVLQDKILRQIDDDPILLLLSSNTTSHASQGSSAYLKKALVVGGAVIIAALGAAAINSGVAVPVQRSPETISTNSDLQGNQLLEMRPPQQPRNIPNHLHDAIARGDSQEIERLLKESGGDDSE